MLRVVARELLGERAGVTNSLFFAHRTEPGEPVGHFAQKVPGRIPMALRTFQSHLVCPAAPGVLPLDDLPANRLGAPVQLRLVGDVGQTQHDDLHELFAANPTNGEGKCLGNALNMGGVIVKRGIELSVG